jgi:hypothetical protein
MDQASRNQGITPRNLTIIVLSAGLFVAAIVGASLLFKHRDISFIEVPWVFLGLMSLAGLLIAVPLAAVAVLAPKEESGLRLVFGVGWVLTTGFFVLLAWLFASTDWHFG